MGAIRSTLAQMVARADRPGVRAFFLSMVALSVALVLALFLWIGFTSIPLAVFLGVIG